MAFTNYQPSLALTEYFAEYGVYPSVSNPLVSGVSHFSTAMVRNLAYGFTPAYGASDGRHLAISSNTALFSIIGTSYGGDGVHDFAVPDLRGTTIVGARSPDGQFAAFNYGVGQVTGSGSTTLDVSQLPAHSHSAGGGATGLTGGGASFDQRQPSLSLTYLISADGIYPGGGTAVSIGQVAAFGGGYVPSGWLPADGTLLSIASYSTLFGLIGTTYGGDGLSNFALPDLRGRTIVGAGTGGGLAPVALGQSFGTDTTTLTLGELPAHDHGLPGGGVTGTTGGGTPVDEHQPSLGLTYIISLEGIFPSRDSALDGDYPYYGEVVAWAGNYAPRGFALADGSLLSIAQNQALFSLLGTAFGGDGIQTFALPDLRGRTIIGTSSGINYGDMFGTDSVSLTTANLPAHDHSIATVPEPASWALMITGFGLTGFMARRGRAVSVAA